MTVEIIRDVLAWCSVHGKWFKLSAERFDAFHYSGMGFFKIGIILFNIVPYFALRIAG